ncbi:MAG: hypothetical protein KUG69_00290 [Marinosulfonomonas sp.]|nr:hypothetical protein [Marinosulfonomonas sp.]
MSRPNPTVLFGFFVAVIVAMCGVSLMKGGLYLGKHEGDTLHLMQIILRMADGQWPHLDFMTPIGVLAVAPISVFVTLGYGAGMAIILSQLLVAAVLLPAIWWTAYSRMRGVAPYLFGLFVIVMVTALVSGGPSTELSISMHYNRWAWAISFIVIALTFIPSKLPPRPGLDGFLIGVMMAALLLVKMTYFVSFALPVVVGMLARRNFSMFLIALLSGLAVMLAISLTAGFDIWQAYLRDLLSVMVSDIRSNPSGSFGDTIAGPSQITSSVALLLAVVLLRNAGEAVGGILLLLLVPGFFYVTYQNFGNDPQWLLILGVILLCVTPEQGLKNAFGWNLRTAVKINAAIALAVVTPSFVNMAFSPVRHYFLDVELYAQLLPNDAKHTDINVVIKRAYQVNAAIALDGEGTALASFAEHSERNEPVILNGEIFPHCEVQSGFSVWFDAIVSDLDQAGLADGKRIFAADLFSSHWMFGPLLPLKGGAPWYYGGVPGIESADYVLVPICAVIPDFSRQALEAIYEAGITLNEVRRTPLYVLLEPNFEGASIAKESAQN